MQHPKTEKPAAAGATTGLQGSQQLSGRLNPRSNTTPPIETQAPDISGEDDWSFFRRRPAATTRTRLVFPNEYPSDFMQHGRVGFVHVTVVRDDRGRPVWAARNIKFCSGGTA